MSNKSYIVIVDSKIHYSNCCQYVGDSHIRATDGSWVDYRGQCSYTMIRVDSVEVVLTHHKRKKANRVYGLYAIDVTVADQHVTAFTNNTILVSRYFVP